MKKVEMAGKNGVGKYALVDDGDYDAVIAHTWYIDRYGYAMTKVKMDCGHYESRTMHKFILGKDGLGKSIDHTDRNKLNNTRKNLRICTHRENVLNRGINKNNTSGFKGVKKNRNFIVAQIKVNGKTIHIGTFKTKEDAARAYDEAAILYNGEHATTNKSLGLLRD